MQYDKNIYSVELELQTWMVYIEWKKTGVTNFHKIYDQAARVTKAVLDDYPESVASIGIEGVMPGQQSILAIEVVAQKGVSLLNDTVEEIAQKLIYQMGQLNEHPS